MGGKGAGGGWERTSEPIFPPMHPSPPPIVQEIPMLSIATKYLLLCWVLKIKDILYEE